MISALTAYSTTLDYVPVDLELDASVSVVDKPAPINSKPQMA